MSFLEKIAEAKSTREALLLIAGALDIIDEKLDNPAFLVGSVQPEADWPDGFDGPELSRIVACPIEGARAPAPLPELGDDPPVMHREGLDYVIPAAPPAIQADRKQFITNYNIPEGDAYVKGGPEWLTAYDTDFVMTLPADARQAMALDYDRRGLAQEAREFAVAFLRGDASNMATAAPLADTLHAGQ